ncbi:LOW QUALITY PROTEIN: hypothetical protein YC2023_094566 [Brassica napus]
MACTGCHSKLYKGPTSLVYPKLQQPNTPSGKVSQTPAYLLIYPTQVSRGTARSPTMATRLIFVCSLKCMELCMSDDVARLLNFASHYSARIVDSSQNNLNKPLIIAEKELEAGEED